VAKLILVTGQKGGVGKTTFALWLMGMLTKLGLLWSGIDTDLANQTFAALGGDNVEPISILEADGFFDANAMNMLVDDLAAKADTDETIIIDVAAGLLPAIVAQMRARQLFGSTCVIQTTIAYVLLNDDASVSTLTQLVDIADDIAGVSWLIVLNERDGRVAQYLDDSPAQAAMIQRNAAQLTIPALRDPAVLLALRNSQLNPIAFCADDSGQPWSLRGQLRTWLTRIEPSFHEHRHLLAATIDEEGQPALAYTAAAPEMTARPVPATRARTRRKIAV
jgi:hypothetical protein